VAAISHCHSCGTPLPRTSTRLHCLACADEEDRLRPASEVRGRIAGWLRSWQPGVSEREALLRARRYMGAMPAWNPQAQPGRGGPAGRRGSGHARGAGAARGGSGRAGGGSGRSGGPGSRT
jgi:hypothetical protein